ncbi:hypothetical protein PHET_06382 [Paragonimus heterotremus]|uniref:Uncharacterized protein n=1 Tax=Paragonimus heterotremus TaxID=100268 RepID=A0A8J4WD46_9TREM|nr:hypothetical protein PHET_06382 [Paragonimus heterotremus]
MIQFLLSVHILFYDQQIRANILQHPSLSTGNHTQPVGPCELNVQLVLNPSGRSIVEGSGRVEMERCQKYGRCYQIGSSKRTFAFSAGTNWCLVSVISPVITLSVLPIMH